MIVFGTQYLRVKQLDFKFQIAALVLTLLLAEITYRFWETPIRHKTISGKKIVIWFVSSVFLVSLLATISIVINSSSFSKLAANTYSQNDINEGMEARFQTRQEICTLKGWDRCDYPGVGEQKSVLVIGDSHAVDALNAMYSYFPEFDYSMSELGGCPPTDSISSLVTATHPNLEECKQLNEKRFDTKYLANYDVLVINVLYGWYPPDEMVSYLWYLDKYYKGKVIVFGSYPEFTQSLPELINDFGRDNEEQIENYILPDPVGLNQVRSQTLQSGFYFFQPRNSLCSANKCTLVNENGVPLTWDEHHMSLDFSTHLFVNESTQIYKYLVSQ